MAGGYSDVLIGLQYGDEGKAKVIDLIAKNYDIVARFNGGPNAGHTVATKKGAIALHQIPSGIFLEDKILYMGSGCVINLEKLVSEIKEVNNFGVDLKGRLRLSDQIPVIQPHHIIIDNATGGSIGTTKNGCGPAYADKALRMDGERLLNIRLGDLADHNKESMGNIRKNLSKTMQIYGIKDFDTEQAMQKLAESFSVVEPYIERDTLFMERKARQGSKILFEGAQSFMLDITKGLVPYVTSSSTLAGAAYVGGDLSPKYHRKTIGVAKAIMSRVGNGPFASEFGGKKSEDYCMEGDGYAHTSDVEGKLDIESLIKSKDLFDVGVALRVLGKEYGASTGRPRRVGILDLVQLAYAVRVNGVDTLFLNKCDLLNDYSKTSLGGIPVVVGYELNGQSIDYVPTSNDSHRQVVPVVEYLEPFADSITEVRAPEELPDELTKFLNRVSKQVSCPIMGIGVGPKREQSVDFSVDVKIN